MSNRPQEKQNPFVGPRPFERDDTSLFKGRSQEAQDLLTLFLSRRLVLLYSPSGAGKTSLLKAKLVPDLEQHQAFEVLPVGRVGDSIAPPENYKGNLFIFNLLASLGLCDRPEVLAADHMSLNQFLLNVGYDGKAFVYLDEETADSEPEPEEAEEDLEIPINPRALIIDQFEEIFTTHPELEAERIAFFRQIGEAMANDPYLYILISMRGDYLFRIIPYVHLLPNSLRARFQLQRLQRAGALEAICEPAAEAGRPFEADVAEALVACLRRVRVAGDGAFDGERPLGDFVEAMQLQVVCQQLWRRLTQRPGNTIGMEDIAWAVGSSRQGEETQASALELFVDNALADYYETSVAQVMAHLHNRGFEHFDEHMVRRWFSKELITEAGTRNLLARMETETKGLPETAVAYLDKHLYLIRNELRAGNSFVELVHDSFVEPIRAANRKWQETLERRIPWLTTARQYAQNPRPGLLLADYNSLQAARIRLAEEVEKGDFPPSTQKFLENYLQEGEEGYQRQLIRDIPWLNSARQHAETQNPDLLFTGKTLQLALEQAAQAKAKGNLPSLVDDFLQASVETERKQEIKRLRQQEEARRREALGQQELAHERSLREQANKAATKQRNLFRLALFVGGIAVVAAILAFFARADAQNAEATAVIDRAAAQAAEATAVVALTQAVANQEIAEEEKANAEAAATLEATARAEAEAAKTQAETLRLLSEASVSLRDREYLSAMLLSLAIPAEELIDSRLVQTSVEDFLWRSLLQVYNPSPELDDLQQLFRYPLSLPNTIDKDFISLGLGPEGKLAVLTPNSLQIWPIQEADKLEEIPFVEKTEPNYWAASSDGTRFALRGSDQQVQVYTLSNDLLEPVTSENDRFSINGTRIAFSPSGGLLLSVFCNAGENVRPRCSLETWNLVRIEQMSACGLKSLQEVTAVTFLDEDTALISGRFNNRPILFVVALTTSAEDCSNTLVELPDDLPTIEQLAFLPEDNLLLSAGDATIQWWQVAYEPLLALTPLGPALAQKATIRSVVPLIGQSAFVILDSNQQLTWYNAKWDFASLSRWACETAGRDLTADEWLTINSAPTIDSFNSNEYDPVCDGYNYPLHSSFAEQTLVLCGGNDSWDKAEALYRESTPGGDFLPWAVATLMVRFYEDEPSFLTSDCWGVLSVHLGDEARQQLEPVAKAINEITAAKDVLISDEYNDELDAITQAIGDSDYPNAFNELLERQNRVFCFDRGFIEACRQLAQRQLTVELQDGNINEGGFWQLAVEPEAFFSVRMAAVDNSFTPYFELLDSEGNYLASSNLSADGRIALFDSTFYPEIQEDDYLIYPLGYYGEASGVYQLNSLLITPQPISLDTPVEADLVNNRLWRFSAEAGQIISAQVTAVADSQVPTLILTNEAGWYLAEGEVAIDGRSAIITAFVIPEEGNYFLQLVDYKGQTPDQDTQHNLLLNSINPEMIALESSTPGDIIKTPVWRFEIGPLFEGSQFIRFSMSGMGNSSFIPALALFNESGTPIQHLTYLEERRRAEAVFFISSDTTYYLHTTGASGETEGQYLIRAEVENGAFPQIAIDGASERGNTQSQPFWVFTGRAEDCVIITMIKTDEVLDTVLSLRDAAGQEIAYNDDDSSSGTYNSRIETELEVDGIYLVHTQGYAGTNGDYELTVQRCPP